MKRYTFFVVLLMPILLLAQSHSWDGRGISSKAKVRCLNIFVNIIYDQHPEYNAPFSDTTYWAPISNPALEGVNNAAIPKYLLDWMDTVYVAGQTHGYCTRLYGESSFDSLQITGDFVVVNLRESTARSVTNVDTLTIDKIGRAAIRMINENGLQTLYGHNTLLDYDYNQDGKVDFMNLLVRNINKQHADINPGSGYGTPIGEKINIEGNYIYAKAGTRQCVGDGNFYVNPTNIVTHEISHSLFGSNAFHTSGGNHRYPDGTVMPFLNLQCGYGLMGAAESGLVSCNGYERWRMHWKHPQAIDYISARDISNTQSVVSDISKELGNRNFILRDFVTYGDVIRIKLPYKDSITSSNQYIWLENHQVGNNNKLDFLQYSNTESCRPQGAAGIYAYYQVGRDVLEGTYDQIWDTHHRDNLKIIPAEGYYDYEMLAETHNVNCVNYGEHNFVVRRGNANPLCGGQDQEFPLFPEATDNVLYTSREYETWRKYIDTVKDDHLPQLGDTLDAFKTHAKINMGTNPGSNNAKTYYSTNYNPSTIISSRLLEKNTQTTYLSGLSIEMTPIQGTGNFLVSIRWDDYDITNDTRWTGKIALKETAILTTGNTITLAQNRTVAQPTRDPETGLFAGRTHWRCENGSYFRQDSASVLLLTENSSLTLESGCFYELSKGATVRVGAGCTLSINPGAKVQFKGMVEIDSGGVLNVYDTVGMGNLSSLVVNPGGKLIVDGGTLTSACSGEMWQGIEVLGNPIQQQLPQYQGFVELRNEATIENAHCAIRTGLHDDVAFATTGGIIKATNVTFLNNGRALEINPYAYTYPSGAVEDYWAILSRCTLKVDNNNLFAVNNVTFSEHVKLWDVKGVLFRGCIFENNTSNPLSSGRGIYVEDAGMEVEPYCPRPLIENECECPASLATYGSFSGFTTAVEVNTTGNPYSVRIDGTSFSNNGTGVRINGNDYATVIRCDFDLQQVPAMTMVNTGLLLNNCHGYKVEENRFHKSVKTQSLTSMGVLVNNSGIFANSIYHNFFDTLDYGVLVTRNNGDQRSGLLLSCNEYNNCTYGIYVESGATIAQTQGSISQGVDNKFLLGQTSSLYNIGSLQLNYYHSSNNIFNLYNPTGVATESNLAILNPCTPTLCDNGIPGGGGGQYLAGFQSDMNAYTTATSNQSPADGTDGGGVNETLSETVRALSETYYTAVRTLLADTVLDLNKLEQWHTVAQPIADPYSLTETRFMMGYDDPFVADADDAELANYADFHAMKLALRNNNLNDNADNVDNNNSPDINWYALTDAQIAQLQTIAERNAGRASVMAKGVLCFFFGICYDDDFLVDDNTDNNDNNGGAETRSAKAAQQDGETHLNVYPNPTDDILYVELSGTGIKSVGLYDLQGRIVTGVCDTPQSGNTAINVRSVPAGVYVLRVTDENGKEYHRKVVVK